MNGLLGWIGTLFFLAQTAFGWTLADGEPLEISADAMTYEPATNTLRFEGNVETRQAAFWLRCEKLTVTAKGKKVTELAASGAVRGHHGDWSFSADLVELDPNANRLDLYGRPSLRRGSDVVTGESIRVFLDRGAFEVRQAKTRWQWKTDEDKSKPHPSEKD